MLALSICQTVYLWVSRESRNKQLLSPREPGSAAGIHSATGCMFRGSNPDRDNITLLHQIVQTRSGITQPSIQWVKVKCSRYRPGVAQRVGRGIALLFHDRGTRRRRVVSSTPRLHFTPGKDPVHILQEAGRAQGPVRTGGKSRPHRDSIPDRPARSQSLYRLSSFNG